uniref:Uncharacterized protein n=1 Tax=Setaria italica TaxID=4555 RepID=K3XPA1_SETIT
MVVVDTKLTTFSLRVVTIILLPFIPDCNMFIRSSNLDLSSSHKSSKTIR